MTILTILCVAIVSVLFIILILSFLWSQMSSSVKINFSNKQILKNKSIHSATILVSKNGKTEVHFNKGEMDVDTPFALASITKLYTHAVIFRLIDQGKLRYDTRMAELLGDEIQGLHTIAGNDYTDKITIRHLLDQTSGLADYETDKLPNGDTIVGQVVTKDMLLDYQAALVYTKQMPAKFAPGVGSKSYYSNMNATLLAKIAEVVTAKTIMQLYDEILFKPLGLTQTRAAAENIQYESFYKGVISLRLPKYLASNVAPGGLISINKELMIFLQSFYDGKLFSKTHLESPVFRFTQWIPVRYGSGMMNMRMPRILSPIIPAPSIIGHSGMTGSFAFYQPSKNILITGTVNQINVRPYSYMYMYLSSLK